MKIVSALDPLPAFPIDHAGVDEAGRGPIAGPLVAAAVIFEPGNIPTALDDSKKLTARKREALYEEIIEHATAYSVLAMQAPEIDKLNIHRATLELMHRCLAALSPAPDTICVDGKFCPDWPGERYAIIKGDARLPTISAASILAKVSRDRIMMEMHNEYPAYGFDRHKGYPTAFHLEQLAMFGPCPEHRQSFRPVSEMSDMTFINGEG